MAHLKHRELAHEALRYTLGGTAFVAGLDKFTHLLTDWDQYLSPMVRERLPISDRNFMRLVGVIEMAVGAAILKGNTRTGGYLAAAWLLGISGNLISTGKYFDIAARDVNMAVGAFALARLAPRARRWQQSEEEIELHRAA
ncbi:MAG TPA: MauE/DoxX family redox-associated membrane protein [Terriglobales bacterium]|nr:MauE/DoxX family redox-associated membrane protein [Terriglobales bacterium]